MAANPTAVTQRWRSLAFALVLLVAGIVTYIPLRPQIFAAFAAGTQWILVTCGFVSEDDAFVQASVQASVQESRWRKLYYAARMFKGTPPARLSPEDALADQRYPGMGFGVLHTFNRNPVVLTIGGWLYSIPCTYFSNARDCQTPDAGTARLRVSVANLAPIAGDTVEHFLSATSPATLRITIAGLGTRPPRWWHIESHGLPPLPAAPPGYRKHALTAASGHGYQLYTPLDADADADQFQCTDPQWAQTKGILNHCLLRFQYNDEVFVEIKFAAQARDQWRHLRDGAQALVAGFQIRKAPALPTGTSGGNQPSAATPR